jgi:restriction system protein
MPVLLAVASFVFRLGYQPATYGLTLFVGVLIGVGFRLIARERERYRARTLEGTGSLEALRSLSWSEFEIAVGELVRRQGYTVKERGGFRADGGVDLIAEGRRGRIAIQCKQWKEWRVREAQVRELYGTVKGGGFTAGWLVTCGVFTRPAQSWAEGKELRLIDGRELEGVVRGGSFVGQAPDEKAVSPPASESDAPECPNCGNELHRRTNTKDKSQFWGCSNPDCSWTFNNAPSKSGVVLCDRGHQMVQRTTKRGVAFWGCSNYPSCLRKRLANDPFYN